MKYFFIYIRHYGYYFLIQESSLMAQGIILVIQCFIKKELNMIKEIMNIIFKKEKKMITSTATKIINKAMTKSKKITDSANAKFNKIISDLKAAKTKEIAELTKKLELANKDLADITTTAGTNGQSNTSN